MMIKIRFSEINKNKSEKYDQVCSFQSNWFDGVTQPTKLAIQVISIFNMCCTLIRFSFNFTHEHKLHCPYDNKQIFSKLLKFFVHSKVKTRANSLIVKHKIC